MGKSVTRVISFQQQYVNLQKFILWAFALCISMLILTPSLQAKLLGADLSAGWQNDQIEVELVQYVSDESEAKELCKIELVAKESNMIFSEFTLNKSAIEELKSSMNNPCELAKTRTIYKVTYTGIGKADNVPIQYQIRWTSGPIEVQLNSADPIMNAQVVLQSEILSSSDETKQKLQSRKAAPEFIACLEQSYPLSTESKSSSDYPLELVMTPLYYAPNLEQSIDPPTVVPNPNELGLPIQWNKGYSSSTPLGKGNYDFDQDNQSITINPAKAGFYIISEGLKYQSSDLIISSRFYILEISL